MSHDEPTGQDTNASGPDHAEADIELIRSLPKEVGVLLMVLGVGGVLLPGPIGSPLVLIGGVVLWPRAFARAERCFQRWFPNAHHQSVQHLHRFVTDLEKRYPSEPAVPSE